ncbi:MAG: MOSC N-terminal beta barrel domain-containing protein [Thermoleophilia bacterium]|nr:MOSC N-terminal beta barrel domain-containing protein [Thermoleophilia bacterium]
MNLVVEQLWRYPVKTLAGERLETAELTASGIPGDRIVHVRGQEGVRTSRRQHHLLGLHGTLDSTGRPLVDGHAWDSPEALALVQAAAGDDAELVAFDGLARFDILPLLVATDGAVAEFGRDVCRLRPNIVIGGVEGLAERQWEGAELRIGDAVI